MREDMAALVAAWSAEYTRVNGKPAPTVTYYGGWFTIQFSAYRKSQLVAMTERLSKRPSAEPAP
jgi:hypothetical protein